MYALLEAGCHDPLPIELELPGRDVGDDDVRAELRELDREAPRAGADVEHAISVFDESAELSDVHRDALRRRAPVLEPRPLSVAHLVEKGGGVLPLVLLPHRASTSARSLSPRPERQRTISSASRSSTRASACEGSSAGMIPSVRVRRRNASSASSSVVPT